MAQDDFDIDSFLDSDEYLDQETAGTSDFQTTWEGETVDLDVDQFLDSKYNRIEDFQEYGEPDFWGSLEESIGDMWTAAKGGTEKMLRSVATTGNVVLDDREAVVEQAKKTQEVETTEDQKKFQRVFDDLKGIDAEADDNWAETIYKGFVNAASAGMEEPVGFAQESVAQMPNMAPTLLGMWAGFKAGGAAGVPLMPLTGGYSVPVMAVLGGFAGMFIGNSAIEGGFIAQEKALAPTKKGEEAFTPQERVETLEQTAKKAGVISTVDGLTMGINRWLGGIGGRQAVKQINGVLEKNGVDIANEAAVKQALTDPTILREAADVVFPIMQRTAGTGHQLAKGGTELLLETGGEFAGEYYGSKAAGIETSVEEAALEGLMAGPHSLVDIIIAENALQSEDKNLGMFMEQAREKPELLGPDVTKITGAGTIDEALAAAANESGNMRVYEEGKQTALDQALDNYLGGGEPPTGPEGPSGPRPIEDIRADWKASEDVDGTTMVPEYQRNQALTGAVDLPSLETELQAIRYELQADDAKSESEYQSLMNQAKITRNGLDSLLTPELRESAINIIQMEDANRIARQQEAEATPMLQPAEEVQKTSEEKNQAIIDSTFSERGLLSAEREEWAKAEKEKLLEKINQIQLPSNVQEEHTQKLKRPDYRNALEGMARDLIKGGGITIIPKEGATPKSNTGDIIYDYGSENIIRTKSLNPEWFQNQGWTISDVRKTVAKALNGYKLGSRQQRILSAMIGHIDDMRQADVPAAQAMRKDAQMERKGIAPAAYYADDARKAEIAEQYWEPLNFDDLPSIAELAQDARDLGVDPDQVDTLLESQADDKTVTQALYDEILNKLREDTGETPPGGPSGPVGGDMFGIDKEQMSGIRKAQMEEEIKKKDVEAARQEEEAKGMSAGPLFEQAEAKESGQMDIEDVEVTIPAETIDENGNVVQGEYTGNAREMLAEIDAKLDAYRQLMACVR